MRASVGPASATGKSAGMTAGAAGAGRSLAAPRWRRPRPPNSAQAPGKSRGAGRALDPLPVGSVPCQDFKRDIELAARGMDRKRGEQPGKRMSKAGVMAQRADIRLAARSEDLRRERDEARGGAVRVGFEIGKRR